MPREQGEPLARQAPLDGGSPGGWISFLIFFFPCVLSTIFLSLSGKTMLSFGGVELGTIFIE